LDRSSLRAPFIDDEQAQCDGEEPGGQPSAMVSTFLRGIAPDSPKSKVVWWAAAAVALAAVVAVIFIVVSPPAREPDQGRTAAVAATASPQPAAPARAQPATRAPGSEANADQTRVALAATVQRLRNDGNWNVLVLYAAEWTRKEPENAVAWRELSGGYARLHQYNDALDAGNRAVQLAPSDALAWRSLGQINLTVDRLPEAGVAFDKALALNPGDVDALCGAASVAQRQSRPKVTDASSRTVPAAGGCSGPGAGDIVVAPIGTSSVKVVSSGGR
jgi:cytochrome c-type biogenesis protein CcmH/NrfG